MTCDGAGRLLIRHLTITVTMLAFTFASLPSYSQSLDGPVSVCPGDRFGVEWTGPDGAGDAITVAQSFMPPDESMDSAPTSDGNPAELNAPFQTGVYQLRYVQGAPLGVLTFDELIVDQCTSGGSDEEDWPLRAVEARGTQIDYGDQINRSGEGPFGPAGYSIDDLCGASDEIGTALQMMVGYVETAMQQSGAPVSLEMIESLPGMPSRAEIAADLRNARDAVCADPPNRVTVQPFVVTYAYCRMAMYTPTHAMDIHLPPGSGDGTMSMADHTTREIVRMTMRRNMDAVASFVGRGWGAEITMSDPRPATPRIGYPTKEYSFEYTGGMGRGQGGLSVIGDMVSVKNEGTMWASDRVPGIDIIRIFYQRLAAEVQPDGGAMSFFGGLINNLVGMLRKGIPLEMDQTTSSSVMGRTMVSGRGRHIVTSIREVIFRQEWCSESLMPSGYTVTDVDQQLSQALGNTDSAEVSQAMEEYNQAMQQMTPEQRAMMESFGMGDMMQQAMGAAAGGAAGGSASMPPAGGGSRPSSAELMTDDMTQSVQNHLQALGYNPGNTSGEASLETTIAISQFQAEKGLAVTGEVSPQLLGVLAAEVDSRR